MKTAQVFAITVSVVFTGIGFQRAMAQLPSESPVPAADTSYASPSQPTSQPAAQAAVDVKIENFAFEPNELQIAVGTTVTWQNADDVPHTATAKGEDPAFDSGPLDTDDKFSFTFSKPGTYAYYCKVHPHMTGVITVK
ncbi:MAG: cupredoxin family copper-binding protein [Tepidisphaeraceae bacterium]